jgi:hypothetical protein
LISDPWRGDHVVDAYVIGVYTILSKQLIKIEGAPRPKSVWEEHQAAFNFRRLRQERQELKGYTQNNTTEDELYEREFGRKRISNFLGGMRGYYENES